MDWGTIEEIINKQIADYRTEVREISADIPNHINADPWITRRTYLYERIEALVRSLDLLWQAYPKESLK